MLKVIRQERDGWDIQHVRRFWGRVSEFRSQRRQRKILPSSSRRSGSQKSARAKASRILQPPEKVLVAKCCRSSENPSPAKILAARDSALSDSISASLEWMSLRVVSKPSRCLSSRSASPEVSAMDDLSASSFDSWFVIFWRKNQYQSCPNDSTPSHTSCSAKRCFRHTSASNTACRAGVSSPVICGFRAIKT